MRLFFAILTAVFTFCLTPAQAEGLATPTGEVVLTISGHIAQIGPDGAAQFDMEMLQALPSRSFETSTIWTEGKTSFVGVPLSVLLEQIGADGAVIRATAINDYAVEIPVSSISALDPIVAYEMDGAAMSRRQKGPLWIVYPYDSDTQYQTEVIYSRSIWQLDRLEIVK
ncbi:MULTISPECIES: molybdopterin-dependent oxidoreductase [unclassified Ruegeria]|uniref:molybdopterin-dependent oxidoreductase n=1 Tax=unclassified Ruegeria TaxID=2625375 RepID=UPI001ADCCCA6|nr:MULTISPECIES: molybdopterin-dependent oxidoreductase [unclassified Ruegeria]MBO9410774.1 molybdopterin-dependent oxidoreductase [Ruegeria sp. R8_1]MBO9414975.1 molybdopterin-dependent oxidoreductase [Ruegeria sp. R8_2]